MQILNELHQTFMHLHRSKNKIISMLKLIISIYICFSACMAMAQNNNSDSVKIRNVSDSTASRSPIPSLTYEEYMNYKMGKDPGMAKAADMNNYPGPMHVLNWEKELKLSVNQKSQIQSIYDIMKKKTAEMGDLIFKEEKKLNDLFASGKANEGSIIYYSNKIGLLQGELRNTYLQAHLKTQQMLTIDQVKKYRKLRNYSN
jgi:Spy/CpxP family protein refolding chaperone